MADPFATLIAGGETSFNQLLGLNGTVATAAPAAATAPALSGAAQPQSGSNGQGAVAKTPVNYVPWVAGGVAVLLVITLIVMRR